ncbi:unannotated protein [freshwater metagenome]|uniref:Unannotated protein n=1 Tax=freshwater metagenome TaxID=449393 RepID=A0A6J6R8I8_9ZZZZ
MPGAANGITWLGLIQPAFASDVPYVDPPVSTTITDAPSFANSQAQARPIIPPPTTVTLIFELMSLA